MGENRVYPRANVQIPTWVRWGDESYKRTYALDLSEQGALLAAATPLPAGTPLELELQVDPGYRVKAQGTVRWCKPEPNGQFYHAGVSLRLPSGQRAALGPFIRRKVAGRA